MNLPHDTQISRAGVSNGSDGWALATPPAGRRPAGKDDSADQPQPLHKMHRLLRGRYKLAITLSLICALGLASAGYFLPKPQFRSDGLIEIKPNIPSLKDTTIVMPLYTQYVESQVNFILGQRVMDSAMETPWWKPYSIGLDPKGKKEFAEKLEAEYIRGTFLVRVSFTDPNPDRAQAAVKAVIKSYSDTYKDEDTDDLKAKLQLVNTTISNTNIQKKMLQDDLTRMSGEYTPHDLEELHGARLNEMVLLSDKLTQAELSLYTPAVVNSAAAVAAHTAGAAATTQPVAEDLSAEQLVKIDPRLQQYIAQRDAAADDLDKLKGRLGPNHPMVQEAEKRLMSAESRLAATTDDVRSHVPSAAVIASADPRTAASVTPAMIQQQIGYLKAKIEATDKDLKSLGKQSAEIQSKQQQISELEDKIADATKTREQLNNQLDMTVAMNGRVQVRSEGDRPNVPTTDRRRQAAVLGFLGGGSLPFVFFMLVGLADKRYRYSDETGNEAGNAPLLGILPNLPDLLTDPQQAAIAAHCVHQIRTLLQVGVRTHDRHVYAVTSAAPGDGKTSLTLALGLSFANSGSRTLLIDCDLVGGSLSRRLGVRTADGTLEAMASRNPLNFVQQTDVNDLAILPVGSATMLSSGSFSPAGLRRLIAEARKAYDIVLIDTGPILGSIEAPSVAASADATILCVSRGQHRPAVDRSMHHLIAIGARIAGIVFNRAENRDFEKSVSRFSQRSIRSADRYDVQGNGNSAALRLPGSVKVNPDAKANVSSADVDPLTRAVTSDFKGDNGNDPRANVETLAMAVAAPMAGIDAATAPATVPAGQPRTIWGLDPQQLHHRYWAAHGVQVVQQGEPSQIVRHAELYLLTDARSLVLFKLADVMDALNWIKPQVLFVRLQDTRERGYREKVVTDPIGGRFARFTRLYDAADDLRLGRVVLTPDREIARLWQNAPDSFAAWRRLRRYIPRTDRLTCSVNGTAFNASAEREVAHFLHDLLNNWKRPDVTVARARTAQAQVWKDPTTQIDANAKFVGPVWIGAGRHIDGGSTVIGPAIVWDDPAARPALDSIRWLNIEPTEPAGADDVISTKDATPLDRAFKRLFDLAFSSLAILVTLPIYPFLILAVWIEDGRPIFFSHRRETLGGREFPCVKFRSMRKDAETIKAELQKINQADGPQFFIENDPRITRVGRILRKYHLDELPQFFNVFMGDMSVVGPRPSPRKENQFCPPWREARLSVRPGITGLWQVRRTRRAGSDFQEWIKYDLQYVERRSFWLDMKIIAQTVWQILHKASR